MPGNDKQYSMNVWELLSIPLALAVGSLFSGPRAAMTKSIRTSSFEVFVEMVDRTKSILAPALSVLLPAAFLSVFLTVLTFYRESPKLFCLNATALFLFSCALFVAIVFELPLTKEISKWPGFLAIPNGWQRTRKRWLWMHIARVALCFASLLLLITAASLHVVML